MDGKLAPGYHVQMLTYWALGEFDNNQQMLAFIDV